MLFEDFVSHASSEYLAGSQCQGGLCGRRTERAKAKSDPTSNPTNRPTSGLTSGPTRAPTRVDLPCFQPFKDCPRKVPQTVPRRCPPLKWSGVTSAVFTCSVPRPLSQWMRNPQFFYASKRKRGLQWQTFASYCSKTC